MNQSNPTITVIADKNGIRLIEQFTETLCDHLMINDTYFGNILTSLNELYNIWIINHPSDPIILSYNTDFLSLNIIIEGFNQSIAELILQPEPLTEGNGFTFSDKVFVIQHLTEKIQLDEENNLQLTFDISAIHNQIYQERARLLHAYFNTTNQVKVSSDNDHF
jgi:hypothetical protein